MGDGRLDLSPEVRFSCQQCGDCCRGLSVSLLPEERTRLEDFDWPRVSPRLADSELFVLSPGRADPTDPHFQLARVDGSCIFLEPDNRCLIHLHLGYEAKPLACRLFPYVFVESTADTLVSASFACRAVAAGLGLPLCQREAEIEALWHDPSWAGIRADGARVSGWIQLPERIVLTANIGLDRYSYEGLERTMDGILEEESHTVAIRLLAMHSLVEAAVAEYGRGARNTAPFATWLEHMNSGRGERWLYQESAGKIGSFGHQRSTLAPLISLVEARWAADRGIALMRGVLGQAMALAQGRGTVLLPSLSAEVGLEAMSRVRFDQDSPELRPILLRYLREWLRRKGLLLQPSVRKGVQYLLVYFALIRWYAVALAVARGRNQVGEEELLEALRTVERNYVHHNLLPKLLAEQVVVSPLVNLLMDLVASPADLVANFYRGLLPAGL